jgi:hypothetical protein
VRKGIMPSETALEIDFGERFGLGYMTRKEVKAK